MKLKNNYLSSYVFVFHFVIFLFNSYVAIIIIIAFVLLVMFTMWKIPL